MTLGRDLYTANRFWVEIEGITEAIFSECSGLDVNTEVLKIKEGGLNGYEHQLPGRTTFSNLTLKRGIATASLWNWYYAVTSGRVTRRNLSVVMLGFYKNNSAKTIRWNVTGALPIKWSGTGLKADGNDIVVETLELAHQGFKRV